MSAGYPSSKASGPQAANLEIDPDKNASSMQLQLVVQPQEPSSNLEITCPAVRHQMQVLSFDTIQSFGRRTQYFYRALEQIAQYLPNEGDSAKEAMLMVTQQRQWMFDVGCAVGNVVGNFYQLERNTLSELEVMWKTGQADLTLKSMKKNFRATSKNLEMLTSYREETEGLILECEKYANQMVNWHGSEQKVQHAVMQLIGKFGGSAQCEAMIQDMQRLNKELNDAQEEEKNAAKNVCELAASKADLDCRQLVMDSIASNEKGSLQTLQRRAEEKDKEAASQAEKAANTFNIEYKKRSWFFGSLHTDWVDNQGDVAAWRADRFKSIAKDAKESETNQQERAKKAASEAAAIQGKVKKVTGELEHGQKTLADKMDKVVQARASLTKVKNDAHKLRESFGNIDLHHLASLRDHMQKFPELLGAQGMEDQGMFSSMKGALKQHKRLCDRMEIFLDEPDDDECQRLLDSLKPVISQAIHESHFFASTLAPLKDAIDKCMKSLPPPGSTVASTAVAAPPVVPSSTTGGDQKKDRFNLRDVPEDELW